MGGRGSGSGFRAGAPTETAAAAAEAAVRKARWDEDGWGDSSLVVPGVGHARMSVRTTLLGTEVSVRVFDTPAEDPTGHVIENETFTSGEIGDGALETRAREFAEEALLRAARSKRR